MTREYVSLLDTSLRDGAQTTGIDFSLADKRQAVAMLDDLGVDYIEAGYPGANPLDTALFEARPRTRAKFAAFGMTVRAGRSVSNDPGLVATLAAQADAVVFVAKTWDFHVRVALGATLDENVEGIAASVAEARARGREVLLDCEHFFDGYAANPAYALRCAQAAFDAGARWIVLCDTNGGTQPHEVERVVGEIVARIPGDHVGIHAHNDTEQAVANSFAAVRAGARQIQGTLNGIGERCGNANLVSILPTLLLKPDFADRFTIGVTPDKLAGLTKLSHAFDEMLNRAPFRHAPYVGDSAFATKAGIHASAVLKDPRTYEHVLPEAVGNRRKLLISDQGGKSNILAELERLGVPVARDDPRVARLLDEVKEREALGYAYEGADASFVLLARRVLGEVPQFFDVERFRVNVERRYNSEGQRVTVAEAVVKVTVDGQSFMSVAEGTGPVHALDLALRKDLGKYQGFIEDLELLDYRVRIFQGGSDAVTRVLVECGDGDGERWSTVGVSANIIDASFQALVDAINYKLLRAGAT